MSRIFISYASEDRDTALQLYRDLRQEGLEPWIDVEDLLGGQDWRLAIGQAIRSSSHVLALISRNSVSKRGYVQKELHYAIEALQQVPPEEIFLIPIRLEDVSPSHPALINLHRVDLFASYEEGLQRIFKSIGVKQPPQPLPAEKKRSPSVPLPNVVAVIQPRPEQAKAIPRFPAGPTFIPEAKPEAAHTHEDHWNDCVYDEDGNCINDNQKHWGSNE